jgi:hypothetical protein
MSMPDDRPCPWTVTLSFWLIMVFVITNVIVFGIRFYLLLANDSGIAAIKLFITFVFVALWDLILIVLALFIWSGGRSWPRTVYVFLFVACLPSLRLFEHYSPILDFCIIAYLNLITLFLFVPRSNSWFKIFTNDRHT